MPVVVVVLPAQVQPAFLGQRTAEQAEIKTGIWVAVIAGRYFGAGMGAAGERAIDDVVGIGGVANGVASCIAGMRLAPRCVD